MLAAVPFDFFQLVCKENLSNGEPMSAVERRRSDRLVPLEADEELVFIHYGGRDTPARLVDFSKEGVLLDLIDMLIDWECYAEKGEICDVSMYHESSIFQVKAKVVRKTPKALALEFAEQSPKVAAKIDSKYERLAALCARINRLVHQNGKTTRVH
jgi:hypothetical protein